jgi:hypothetical protein
MVGLSITGYEYALATSADSYATYGAYQASSWTSGTSFTITGLTNGTLYKVKIRAVNPIGKGAESSITEPFKPYTTATVTTTTGSDATTTPTAPTTSAPTSTQSFGTLNTQTYTSGSGTWTNPYPSGATTGTGTLNGSSGTTHFVWGTSSGSYPNEVTATSNAYVRTTWPRGTTVYYKARVYNTSCTATFNGTVNSNGASTTVTFVYGTSSIADPVNQNYPSSISAGTVTALTATAVTANAASLTANTYYYRTKAVNAAGTTYGEERSITVSAKSATAASEQSFTPPTVGTLYELVCAGGGGGTYGGSGGGGGAVAYYSSVAAPASVSYTVGGGGSANNPGGTSTISFPGVSMSGGGGGVGYWNNADYAGSSGVASGGTSNYPSSAYPGGGYGYVGDSDVGFGGGGGAGGNGGSYQVYNSASQIYAYGGNGGPAVTVNGNTFGAGGGGYGEDWRYPPGGPSIGNTPASDYGRGAFRNQAYAETAGTGGLVRFKYYGP